MTPDIETTVQNVLKSSGMFTDAQASMAVVALDPVIASIEEERDENLKMMKGFRARVHDLEDKVKELEERKDRSEDPELEDGEPSPFKDTPYMTIVPSRSPSKKVHPTLGQARGAISYHIHDYGSGSPTEMELYEFKGNRWRLLHKFPKGTHKKDIPGGVDD